jgi:DNA-3-methyladenine glycosylase II
MQTRTIAPESSFAFDAALRYLAGWTAATFEDVDLPTLRYRRGLHLHGQDVLLTVQPDVAARLRLDVGGDCVTPDIVEAAERVIVRTFSLDTDPSPFLAIAQQDPALGTLVEAAPGLRPVTFPDPFEALIWAVLGQQINVAFARRLKQRLIELCGRTMTLNGSSYQLMPTPDAIAALDPNTLLERQYSRQKASYVIGLAQAVASGELVLEQLRSSPADDAIAELTRFRGIGRWTAEYLLMRAFGHTDAIPAGDVSLQLLIGTATLGRRVNEAELRAVTTRWSPWQGWAAFYFWSGPRVAGRVETATE